MCIGCEVSCGCCLRFELRVPLRGTQALNSELALHLRYILGARMLVPGVYIFIKSCHILLLGGTAKAPHLHHFPQQIPYYVGCYTLVDGMQNVDLDSL